MLMNGKKCCLTGEMVSVRMLMWIKQGVALKKTRNSAKKDSLKDLRQTGQVRYRPVG
jgi:hypothetical protein